jgi:hypothetical protein
MPEPETILHGNCEGLGFRLIQISLYVLLIVSFDVGRSMFDVQRSSLNNEVSYKVSGFGVC